jgi:hypothetical protein
MKAIRAKECIYCRQPITRPPREHVIPEAFGRFEHAPVLHCVCARCNHFFSTELELVFARKSGEGYARLYSGLRPEIARTPTTDVTGIDLPGPWHGARVQIRANPAGGVPIFEIVPQVAFKTANELLWIAERDLTPARVKAVSGQEIEAKIVCNSDEEFERLAAKLKDLDIIPTILSRQDTKSFPVERLRVGIPYHVDHVMARCVAKIAFNYLAWTMGPPFLMNPCFDEVRAYILRGEFAPGQSFLSIRESSILSEEQIGPKVTGGHVLAINWGLVPDQIIAYVSLFNSVHYSVVLSHKYVGLWFALSVGHHFDVKTKKISTLVPMRIEI